MKKVLVNCLLLSDKFSGVQYSIKHLFDNFIKVENPTNLRIEGLFSKEYTQSKKADENRFLNTLNLDSKSRLNRIYFEHFKLNSYAARNNFDLLHCPGYILPFFGKAKTLLTVHDLIALDYPEFCQLESSFYFKLFQANSIRKADKIIAVSSKVKSDIIDKFDIAEEKIEVIYHGIAEVFKRSEDLNNLARVRIKYRLPEKFILFVGNIEPKKNLNGLINAFYKVRKATDLKVKLVLAGKQGWKYGSVFKNIENKNLTSEIVITDYVVEEDLPVLYSLAEAFIFPSFYEGFGLPALEAMACKLPVVISNKGALPETTGNKCLQIDPYNEDELAKAIITILTDENLRMKTINEGFEWSRKFTWEKASKKTLNLYNLILSNDNK